MKKSIVKSILLILVMVILFTLLPIKTYAGPGAGGEIVSDSTYTPPSGTTAGTGEFSFGNIMSAVKEFMLKGETADAEQSVGEIVTEIQPIINALYWAGVAVVMGAAMFLGVQYFQATGDPKTRAEIQGKLIGFGISAAVLLAAFPVWSFLVKFVTGLMQ